jgi:hypothetical protein
MNNANRRHFLSASAALLAVFARPGIVNAAASGQTAQGHSGLTITELYSEWERRYEIANRRGMTDDEGDAASNALSEIEDAMLPVGPRTMEELAMKVGATSGFGDFPLPREVANELLNFLYRKGE